MHAHSVRLFSSNEATFQVGVEQTIGTCCVWGVKILIMLLNMNNSLKVNVCCALTKNKVIGPFFFQGSYDDWWHFSGCDGEHCFASCACGKIFPVTWCTTSLLPSCLCPSRLGVLSDHWIGRGGPIPWPPHSPDLTPLDFSSGGL
jgi:hypothetical protein